MGKTRTKPVPFSHCRARSTGAVSQAQRPGGSPGGFSVCSCLLGARAVLCCWLHSACLPGGDMASAQGGTYSLATCSVFSGVKKISGINGGKDGRLSFF